MIPDPQFLPLVAVGLVRILLCWRDRTGQGNEGEGEMTEVAETEEVAKPGGAAGSLSPAPSTQHPARSTQHVAPST